MLCRRQEPERNRSPSVCRWVVAGCLAVVSVAHAGDRIRHPDHPVSVELPAGWTAEASRSDIQSADLWTLRAERGRGASFVVFLLGPMPRAAHHSAFFPGARLPDARSASFTVAGSEVEGVVEGGGRHYLADFEVGALALSVRAIAETEDDVETVLGILESTTIGPKPEAPEESLVAAEASASDTIVIGSTERAPVFDGRCDDDEWRAATRVELPAQVTVHLMHDRASLFVCAEGKAEDYTVLDLYIEDGETGDLHNLHASAQLGERVFTGGEWSASEFWNHEDWGGFWVPYAGEEETEDGARTVFLRGSHRELQVLRRRFAGDTWTLMIGVSAVQHEGEPRAELFFPEGAVDTDPSTWVRAAFSSVGE